MFNGDRILAIIPARGGSKGIPRKNIIELCGKPLISYTIEAGLHSKYLDYVMVSTDDKEIAKISKASGADIPFLRPAELAQDESKTIEVILHALTELSRLGMRFDVLVLLQPTEPLRDSLDIDKAIEKFFAFGKRPLVSISEVNDHPLLIRSIEGQIVKPLLNEISTCRRQDMPVFYRVNGCIYINSIHEINETTSFNDNEIPFIMDKSHSVDIDELSDIAMAEYYLNRGAVKNHV